MNFSALMDGLFPTRRLIRHLEAEIELLRRDNRALIDRIVLVTTGIGADGKIVGSSAQRVQAPVQEPKLDFEEAGSPYKWLEDQERRTLEDLSRQESEMRGFSPEPPPPPSGAIGDGPGIPLPGR